MKPIEHDIVGLIPRHSESLPSELIEHANFLFERSKDKCHLKPHQEIARSYACAHLACECLKSSLNLPKIEPNPPIPPASYRKLYEQIKSQLATGNPSHNRSTSVPSTAVQRVQSSPTKQLSSYQASRQDKSERTSNSSQKRKRGLAYPSNSQKESLIPRWVEAVIRYLCKQTQTTSQRPHILAGVESIIVLKNSSGKSQGELQIPALIIAIWLLVVSTTLSYSEELPLATFKETEAREYLLKAKNCQELRKTIGDSPEAWQGWESFEDKEIDAWREEISSLPLKEMDWWRNMEDCFSNDLVREAGAPSELDEDIEMEDGVYDDEVTNQTEQKYPQKTRVRLDKYDYLSQERRQEYANWKNKILLQISTIIATEQ
ncbi:hypothetical protein K3495_g8384 [Podosphaera aphanis]|nr:hypothetical protein K3495_g8384 [Podosphaera aphanis]